MPYHCRDCSYRGKKSAPSGECAACGSFNISPGNQQPIGKSKPVSKIQRIALVVSWSVLLILIARKILE